MKKLFIFVLLTLIISGCLQTNVLEKLGLTIAAGYDPLKNDQFLITTVQTRIEDGEKAQIVTDTGNTGKDVRNALDREMDKKIVSGQLRLILYNKKLASKGLNPLLDSLYRDPSVGTMVFLTVSKGKAEDILSYRYSNIENIGTFLYNNIRKNIRRGQIPSSTLHEFQRDSYDVGRDPMLPILERHGNEIDISGIALFKNDKMVAEASPRESYLIQLIRSQSKLGSLEVVLNTDTLNEFMKANYPREKIYLVVRVLTSKNDIQLINQNKAKFNLDMNLNVDLLEQSASIDLGNPKVIDILQNEISKEISKEVEKVIHKLQHVQSDVVGFGEVYRSSVRDSKLTKNHWHEMFKEAAIDVSVKVRLDNTGIIEE